MHIITSVDFDISINSMTWAGGDQDINSQRGRFTEYSIDAWVQTNGEPHKFRFVVDYRVNEIANNHTQLHAIASHDFEIPTVTMNANIGRAGAMNAHFYHRSKGKLHTWSNITGAPGLRGSYLSEVWRKLDGPGKDTEGNAALWARVKIPVEYDIPDNKPFHLVIDGKNYTPYELTKRSVWDGDDFVEKVAHPFDPELQKLRDEKK